MVRAVEALMPFADQAGGITRTAQAIGDGALIERQAERRFISNMRIELVPESRLVTPREKTGARRTAIRCGHVAALPTHPAPLDRAHLCRQHLFSAVTPDLGLPHFICSD